MDRRLAIVVLLALYLQPAVAMSPDMDISLSVPPMEQFYTDLDGSLRCFECALSYWDCMCALSQSSSSYLPALSNRSSFCEPPISNEYTSQSGLSELFHYVNESSRPLVNGTIQLINVNETTVQSATVQAHVDDTYLPGDRQTQIIRHPPRRNGYVCTFESCNKAYDRKCELNRHLKVHLSPMERPHRCYVCNEGFLYPKDLIRHQRKHVKSASAKITYYCHVLGCNNTEGFSRRDNLLRHHRRQHEGVASPPA